ncbi:MAG: hypothetical protein ACPHCI_06250 [Solirubrobacterales bacterium]
MSDHVVKFNLSDGSIEISSADQQWVDSKLSELTKLLEASDAKNASAPNKKAGKRIGKQPTEKPKGTKSKSANRNSKPQKNDELDKLLTKPIQTKLVEFIEERQTAWDAKQTNRAVILAVFLADELDWHGVDANDLYTIFRKLGLDAPGNFSSMLTNAQARDKYFEGAKDGKFHLSLAGENFARKKSGN